ncbi:MAG TPA: signal peptidase I [Opitutae bacterium]|nr:signal peptidase I [Opitutae bacterium]
MGKLQKQAKELLHSAAKVYHYRKDVIAEARLHELDTAVGDLQKRMKEDGANELEAAMDRLDGLLRKIGGKMYPKTFWNDNIEVALVAAILVIGVRTFFFQPFIIPTNSMYPTYSGMNTKVYTVDEPALSAVKKYSRFAAFGARHRELVAQSSGALKLLLVKDAEGRNALRTRTGGIGPLAQDRYLFAIGDTVHELKVPKEYLLPSLLQEQFPGAQFNMPVPCEQSPTGMAFKLADHVEAGDSVLRFDVLLGDALFVDRVSYHFKRPKVGDPFVFRTDPILDAVGEATNDYTPKYYIKRIGGSGGETLEIKDHTLLVDGQPRDEVEAFGRNAIQEGDYSGYINYKYLDVGRKMVVPNDKFVALGDNSANSADSRYWGYVPEEAVVGKAIFIYYPFTKRWGLAE